MHSVYHFYLVNQPNFVFIIFKISCSCALYSLHLECNLYPHLVIKIIIYIQSNFFRRYILISMISILTNPKASPDRLNFDDSSDNLCEENHTCQVAPSVHRIYRWNSGLDIHLHSYTLYKQDIRNPLSLLAHERSCFAACVHFISTLHFSSFFDHKFTTFTTNLTLLYNTRQNDWCPGKPVKQALPGYTRQDKNQLPLSRGEC